MSASSTVRNRAERPRPGVVALSVAGFALLAIGSWAYILGGQGSGFTDLFAGDTWRGVWGFLGDLAGEGSESTPAFLDGASWRNALSLSVETLAMSVLATALAGVAVLLTFLPAARNVAFGDLSGHHRQQDVPLTSS